MTDVTLHLLGAFEVRAANGRAVASTVGSQRLVALLALRGRVVSRAAIAGALWPEASTDFGAMRLRSALARLEPTSRGLVLVEPHGMSLDPACAVDYRIARRRAERVLETADEATLETADETRTTIALLGLHLLPDFYDDWALEEAEEWRLLRAVTLESLAGTLARDHQPYLAMYPAHAAIRNEPLRETAHVALVRLHITAGNYAEALRAFARFRTALAEAVDAAPSEAFRELVGALPGAAPESRVPAVSTPLSVGGVLGGPDSLDVL